MARGSLTISSRSFVPEDFWVYALSARVQGEPTREPFLEAYAGAIVEQNRVVGTYSRS